MRTKLVYETWRANANLKFENEKKIVWLASEKSSNVVEKNFYQTEFRDK